MNIYTVSFVCSVRCVTVLIAGELSSESSQKCFVAVEVLKDEGSSEARRDFCREVKIMASFNHENVLRLIGVVPIGTPHAKLFRVRVFSKYSNGIGCAGNQTGVIWPDIRKAKRCQEINPPSPPPATGFPISLA